LHTVPERPKCRKNIAHGAFALCATSAGKNARENNWVVPKYAFVDCL
jgi:hypothetical protein